VTLVIDTSAIVASADATNPNREAVHALLVSERGRLLIPAPVTAEIDYLLGERVGQQARRHFLEDLAAGDFSVEFLEPEEYQTALDVDKQYADLELGLADLAIIVLARRFRTRRILTFDHHCFRAVRPLQGGTFTILPADTADQATLPLS
jgi:predicted nucleic acid-binding protein